jgi:uncharacterized protein
MEEQKSIGNKILYFPLTKIILGLVVCTLMGSIGSLLLTGIVITVGMGHYAEMLLGNTAIAVFAAVGYTWLYKYYDKRRVTELSMRGFIRNAALGLLIGAGLQSLVILVIYIAGAFHVNSINPVSYLLPALAISISSSVLEEILLRGIIFRITEEKLGSYIALIISGLVFGFLHLNNPNSSVMMALAIAIEAGLMLGAAYMCTRSLWLPIGIHFGWNFMQGGVYGAAVSGHELGKSLLQTTIEGNQLLTGGAFGPESSVQAIVFGTLVFIMMMVYCHRYGKIIVPFWLNR